ncbi:hypothetical protein QBC39DRAFT_46568 [Podospora conica]|nr:hypothetical protein QBC39DRAFT_46568 [Schizothecium conicum]
MSTQDSQQATSQQPGTIRTITMDNDGDLTVVVGPGGPGSGPHTSTFLVCSHALSRSSPIFKTMLYGSFRESRLANTGPEPWTVKLPDDHPTHATILFNIVHSHFNKVSAVVISLELLYGILAFTDKYDMTVLLAPWLQAWVSSVYPLQADPFNHNGPRAAWAAITVSRELGATAPLKDLVRSVVLHARPEQSRTGELVFFGRPLEPRGSQQWPLSCPEVFETASTVRLECLSTIFEQLRTTVLGLQHAIARNGALFCKDSVEVDRWTRRPFIPATRGICHSTSLGFILSALGPAELKLLWAETDSELYPELLNLYPFSVHDLVQKIKGIKIPDYNWSFDSKMNHTAACSPLPAIAAGIDVIVASDRGHLTDETTAYLEKQRIKFGNLDFAMPTPKRG